ncbi:MAG: SDR family oxidoreductase [Gammaproteobacteria bacterium]|nr:SDR family oxidoreductase [Gammaproteobacteria bacterium]
MLDFSGKAILVVGGTSGINRGIAEAFARAGGRVAVASRDPAKVSATVEALQQSGGEAFGFSADVRDLAAVEAGVAEVYQAFGSIDVLVSGAAGNFPALAERLSSNGFRAVMEIDTLGTFHVMRATRPYLTTPGASVINISAPQAFVPMQAQVHVCAAKAGVDMITRTLALEWGAVGIRINSIVPGPIDGTEGMARLAPTAELREKITATVPLKRFGTALDIAGAAMFLASDMARYISGAVLPVDGGWSLSGCGALGEHLTDLVSH